MDNCNLNSGVFCDVKSCRYHYGSNGCSLRKISVTSEPTDKHYCGSFEKGSDII